MKSGGEAGGGDCTQTNVNVHFHEIVLVFCGVFHLQKGKTEVNLFRHFSLHFPICFCVFFPACRHCRIALPALRFASTILLCRSFSFVFSSVCSRLNLNVYPAFCSFAHFCNLLSHVSLCIFPLMCSLTFLYWFFTFLLFDLLYTFFCSLALTRSATRRTLCGNVARRIRNSFCSSTRLQVLFLSLSLSLWVICNF